jgi:hypothetical protein
MAGRTVSYDDTIIAAFFAANGVVDKLEASDWITAKDHAFLTAIQADVAASENLTKQQVLRLSQITLSYLNDLTFRNA